MVNIDYILKGLKHIVLNRKTKYSNSFPYNCGYIYQDSGIACLSFDCIGLVKSMINNPDIAYKTTPLGYYVKPSQIIPDETELGILNLCTDVSWGIFKNIQKGFYLYKSGHGAWYVGNLFGDNSDYNVIECTKGNGYDGVVATWIDIETGERKTKKNGTRLGSWMACGKLDRYIDYGESKKTNMEIAEEVIDGKWGDYPSRKTKLEEAGYDYAAIQSIVNDILSKVNQAITWRQKLKKAGYRLNFIDKLIKDYS